MFNLDQAQQRWTRRLIASGVVSPEEIDELSAHLAEQVAELRQAGLTEEEAFLIASRRMGDQRQLADEFLAADPARRWLQRVLWGVLMLTGIVFVALAFSSVIWLAEGGWSDVKTNLLTLFEKSVTGANPVWIVLSAGVMLTCFMVLCRRFPEHRKAIALILSACLIGYLGYQLAMQAKYPMVMTSSGNGTISMDRSMAVSSLVFPIAISTGIGLGLWLKQRKLQSTDQKKTHAQ